VVGEEVFHAHELGDGIFAHGNSRRAREIILDNLAALDFVMPANEQDGDAAFDRFYPLSACAPKG
jgi:hypothetical protein